MKGRSWVAVLVCLAFVPGGCGAAGRDKNAEAVDEANQPSALTREELERYWPLSNYRRYPAGIRPLLQAADAANDQCRSNPNSAQQRACNRRYQNMVALERSGWCWGGGRTSAEDHWLRCADIAGYLPGEIEAQGRDYSEWTIRWTENRERLARGEPGVGPLPPGWEQLLPSRTTALAGTLGADELAEFPLATYDQAPALIRPLLQRADVFHRREGLAGRGAHPSLAARMRAANAAYLVDIEAELRGWCNRDRNGPWRLCAADPAYKPGEVAADGRLNPEALIVRRTEFERRRRLADGR